METGSRAHKSTEQMKRIDRSSNIEVLRIVCMVFLIAHHCIVHGGALSMDNCVNKWIGFLFVPVGKICFDAFVAISAWYTVDSKFKASRFFKIWFQILFYNLVFTGLTALLGNGYAQPITWRTWLGAFFPVIGNSHGFAASYVIYYLCTPFLHYVAERLTKQRAALLVGILFLTQVFSTIMGAVTFYTQPMPSEILLFVLFYFTAFYLKRWPIKLEKNMLALGLIVLGIWFGSVGAWVGNAIHPDSRFYAVTIGLSGNELSLNNIIAGFALFFFFKNLKMPQMPRLNLVASVTFGILLFHDHNYFRPVVWGRMIRSASWLDASPVRFTVYIILSVAVIFVLGALIDFARQKIVEAPLMRSGIVTKVCGWLDGIIQQKLAYEPEIASHQQAYQRVEQSSTVKSCEIKSDAKRTAAASAAAAGYYQRRFSIAVLVCVALYWLVCIATRSSNISSYFVFDHHDTGMDYFHMLANLSHDDPWYASANYPAMCFLCLRAFWRMIPQDVDADGVDGFALRENMIAQLGYIFLLMVCLAVIWELSQHFVQGKKADKMLFAASLVFSGPMIFLLERGNLLLLSLVSLLGYLALYNSPKKSLRYAGYICLAFSAAIKIYPAVFGLLVPMRKRWKETGHLFVIGAAMFLIPFFFFNGVDSILAMFRGFTTARDVILGNGLGYNFSFRAFLSLYAASLGIYNEIWPAWVLLIPLGLSVWIIIIGRQEWQKLFGMVLMCVWLPDFSYSYTLTFFFLPLISFLRCKQKRSRFNTLYTIFFVLLLIPYYVPMLPAMNVVSPLGAGLPASCASLIINCVIIFFAFAMLLEHYLLGEGSSAAARDIPAAGKILDRDGILAFGRRSKKWILPGIILFTCALLFSHILTGNAYLLVSNGVNSDPVRVSLPTYYQLYDSIASGGSFWSWRMGIGTSMFTHADVCFDPFTYLLFLAGRAHIPDMFIWMFSAKILCQGLGMYGYLQNFKLHRSASVLASVMYAFCGYSLIMGSNFALGTIMVYIPLVLWAAEKWLDGGRPWPLAGLLFLTAVYSYYFFYQTGIILCAYIIIRGIQKKLNVVKYAGILAALGVSVVLLASPVLLPQLELTLGSTRVSGASGVDRSTLWLPQLSALATTLIRMVGNDWLGCGMTDTYRGYLGDYFQYSCYFGMLSHVVVWYYIRTEKKDRRSVLLIAAILAVAVLFPITGYVFNGFSETNARWMFIIPVLQCIVSAKCLNKIASGEAVRMGVLLEGIVVTILVLLLGMAVLSWPSEDFAATFLTYVTQAKIPFLAFGIISISVLVLAFAYGRSRRISYARMRSVRWIFLLLTVVIVMGDIRFNYVRWFSTDMRNYYTKADPIYDDESQSIIQSIQGSDGSFYRMYKNFDSVYDSFGIPSENDAMAQGYYGLKSYNSINHPEYVRYLQTNGIYVCIPHDIERYRSAGISPREIAGQTLNYIDGVENDFLLMDYLGVKYYLAQNGTANVDSGYTHLYAEQGIDVYQNDYAYPLAFVNRDIMSLTQFEMLSNEQKRQALMTFTVLDSNSLDIPDIEEAVSLTEKELASSAMEKNDAFELVSFSSDKVVFNINVAEENAYLSMTIPYDNDWHIYIDGEKVESEKINIGLLGAKIGYGTHEVTVQYSPKLLYIGMAVSIVTAIPMVLLIYRDYRKKKVRGTVS